MPLLMDDAPSRYLLSFLITMYIIPMFYANMREKKHF